MIVHRPQDTRVPRHLVFVQPAATPQGRGVSEWMDGGKPRLFTVEFLGGRADVPDNLGRYLVDAGLARPSPILLPDDARLPIAMRD